MPVAFTLRPRTRASSTIPSPRQSRSWQIARPYCTNSKDRSERYLRKIPTFRSQRTESTNSTPPGTKSSVGGMAHLASRIPTYWRPSLILPLPIRQSDVSPSDNNSIRPSDLQPSVKDEGRLLKVVVQRSFGIIPLRSGLSGEAEATAREHAARRDARLQPFGRAREKGVAHWPVTRSRPVVHLRERPVTG